MDFWATVRVLLRRWYVAVPVLLISLGGTAAVYSSIPTTYESTGTLVLVAPSGGATVGPEEAGDGGTTNPLLAFDSSLDTTAQIVISSLGSPETQEQLGLKDSGVTYEVGNGLLPTAGQADPLQDLVSALTFYPVLALAGLRVLLLRRWPLTPTEKLVAWLVVCNALLLAVFFTRLRLRTPVDGLLILLTATAVANLVQDRWAGAGESGRMQAR